jgi:threonine dehydratase
VIGIEDVRAAHEAIRDRVHRTPLLSCASLGEGIALKAESFQRTGSFKIRGALNRVARLTDAERSRGVITFSAGNHAQAVALACRDAGVDALVLMPSAADASKVAATRGYGATVDQAAATAADLLARASEIIESTGRTLVHPFDDPHVMAGQGTLALELLEQAPDLDTWLVPVSGGGLIGGIATVGGAAGVRVVGVEPAVKPTVARALGRLPEGPSRPTIADALTAPFVGALCLEIIRAHVADVLAVTEEEIAEGVRFLHGRAKLVAEPGAAVGVAALLSGRYVPAPGERVGVVVSGGNVAGPVAAAILDGRLPS